MTKRLVITALFCLIGISDAHAQRVVGRLLDEETLEAISNASITLLNRDSTSQGQVITNATGNFQLPVPREGRYRLRAERIGYSAALTNELTIGPGEQVVVDLRLSAKAIQLEAVSVVVAAHRPGELRGFYDRMGHSASGSFITRDQIELWDRHQTIDVLSMGGLRVTYPRRPGGVPTLTSGQSPCMRIVIDGVRDQPNSPTDLNSIPPEFIEGIEIYKNHTGVPPQFIGGFDECGAILIWTTYSR